MTDRLAVFGWLLVLAVTLALWTLLALAAFGIYRLAT